VAPCAAVGEMRWPGRKQCRFGGFGRLLRFAIAIDGPASHVALPSSAIVARVFNRIAFPP